MDDGGDTETFEIFEGDGVVFVERENLLIGGFGAIFVTELEVAFGEAIESGDIGRGGGEDLLVKLDGFIPATLQGEIDSLLDEGLIAHEFA